MPKNNECRLAPAEDLHLEIDKSFYKFAEKAEDKDIANFKASSRAIPMFAPGAELVFHLAQGFQIFAPDADPSVTPNLFSVTARYKFGNGKVAEKNTINLTPYEDSNQPKDTLVSQLKKLNRQ